MDINEADKNLFRATVENINPPDKDAVFDNNQQNKQHIFQDYQRTNPDKLLNSHDVIKHSKNGVSSKIIKKLKQGNLSYTPSIDLHGQTVDESFASLAKFIHYHQHKQFIQVIHGKGYNSSNNHSILKTEVASFLKKHPSVLAYHSCPPKNGGTGAVFVYLKTQV
jgi:DNA-nicking Smr family endonuclease